MVRGSEKEARRNSHQLRQQRVSSGCMLPPEVTVSVGLRAGQGLPSVHSPRGLLTFLRG